MKKYRMKFSLLVFIGSILLEFLLLFMDYAIYHSKGISPVPYELYPTFKSYFSVYYYHIMIYSCALTIISIGIGKKIYQNKTKESI
ncbi:MAG: hypothetical protein JXQ23_00395 [Clostridia bacterium]|nr:hypothetical protein [Clostridia bacterium]